MRGDLTVTGDRRQETGKNNAVVSGPSFVVSNENSRLTYRSSLVFDSMAKNYDSEFTNTVLGKMLRQQVWNVALRHFKSGQHILEINCGTGEDAIWMAKQGMFVTATDASSEMIKVAKEKLSIQDVEVKRRVSFQQKSFSEISSVKVLDEFDGVLSNFGGINTISEWEKLSDNLAEITKPGSKIILVPMGKWCFWEIFWFSVRFDFKKAFRRFHQPAIYKTDSGEMKIWYPTVSDLKRGFGKSFDLVSVQGLGIFLPPSYFGKWVEKFPGLFKLLGKLDEMVSGLFSPFGDHLISVFIRKGMI